MEIPAKLYKGKVLKKNEDIIIFPVTNILNYYLNIDKKGLLAKVSEVKKSVGQNMVEVRGISRVKIIKQHGLNYVDCRVVEEKEKYDLTLVEELRKKGQEFVFIIDIPESDRLIYLMNFISDIHEMTDFISYYFVNDFKRKLILLRESDPLKRARILLEYLNYQISNVKKIKVRLK